MSIKVFDSELSCAKTFASGTHRSRPPEETVRDYSRFMPRLGITRLADVTGLDHIGIPVYMCIRPNARCLSVSQGKGIDVASAKASALMESIEFWHAERVSSGIVYESYHELRRTERVVDIDDLDQFPMLGDSKVLPLPWIEGYDLMRGERVYVPLDCVSLNTSALPQQIVFQRVFNGLASGNNLLEAISHSLSELIERDNCIRFERRPFRAWQKFQLDLDTVTDAGCRQLIEAYDRADIRVVAWDVAPADSLPTYMAAIWDAPSYRHKGLQVGKGAHPSPAVALSRALTEAAQLRLTVITGSRDDLQIGPFEAKNGDAIFGEAVSETPPLHFERRKSLATDTFEGDVTVELRCLEAAGLDRAIVVDLTRADIGIPVVRVIAPGGLNAHGLNSTKRARARLEIERDTLHS